jgi:hypothetical protein
VLRARMRSCSCSCPGQMPHHADAGRRLGEAQTQADLGAGPSNTRTPHVLGKQQQQQQQQQQHTRPACFGPRGPVLLFRKAALAQVKNELKAGTGPAGGMHASWRGGAWLECGGLLKGTGN